MNKLISTLVAFFAASILLYSTVFIVDQRSYAIVFAFGEVKSVVSEPGLHFKLPAPLQNVIFLENRILTIESPEAERFITAEKKNILVDTYVKWRIAKPELYFVSFGNDEARARNRLSQIVKEALNEEVTKRTVRDVISGQRDTVMQAIRKKVTDEAISIGVGIVDVRLERVDYVQESVASVYERMKAERFSAAKKLRATGGAENEKIRAEADRTRTEVMAKAEKEAQTIRGAGDAEAAKIYAQAFSQNPEFYRFYRSLEAYRASFKSKNDFLLVDPNSEFFKYFKAPGSSSGATVPTKK